MQKNNYQLKFIAGELAGRSFVLPPEGLLIGWCAIGVMLTLEVIGYFIIRMIVDIKV